MMINQNEDRGGRGESCVGAGGDSFHTQLQEQHTMIAKLREETETRFGNMQQQLNDISSTMHLILSKMPCTTLPNQSTPAGCNVNAAAVSTQHNSDVRKDVQQVQVTEPLDETLVTGTLCFPEDWFHPSKGSHFDKSMNQ